MRTKAERHRALQDAVAQHHPRTQDELCGILQAEGFDVTQSTVSRDISELGLVRDSNGYALNPKQTQPVGQLLYASSDTVKRLDRLVHHTGYEMHKIVQKALTMYENYLSYQDD